MTSSSAVSAVAALEAATLARPITDPRRGVPLALTAAVFWSGTSVLIDRLLSSYRITPVELSFWRVLLSASTLALVIAIRHPSAFRLSRREVPHYVASGLLGVAALNVLWSASVQLNKAAVAAVLVFSAPVFVAVAGRLLFGERLSAFQTGAIVANLFGCALVGGIYDPAALARNPAGLAMGVASGVAFATYTILGKRVARVGRRGSLTILFYSFLIAAVGLCVCAGITQGSGFLRPRLDPAGWLLLLGLVLGPTVIGYGLFTASLKHLPSALATLITTLEPPLAAILALVVLNRAMNGLQWLGTALIIGGMIVMQGIGRRGAS